MNDERFPKPERVVIVGLSMGGALTAWLGSGHPEVAGLVCIQGADHTIDHLNIYPWSASL